MPAPTATITLDRTSVNGSQTAIVTIEFSEGVEGVALNALSSSYGSFADLTSSDGVTYTATYTPDPNLPSTLDSVSLDLSSIASASDGTPAGGPATSPDFTVDTRLPTVFINLDDYSLTVDQTATVTFTFSEEVNAFTAADLNVEGGAVTGLAATADPKIWLGTFTPTDSIEDATNVISLKTGQVTDLAGNAATATTSNYTIDTKAPTVTIAMSDSTLTAGETSIVTFTFSERIDILSVSDLTATNGAFSGVSSSDGGQTWTATFTPTPGEFTTNVITVKNASVADLAGNANSGATSFTNYVVDTVGPTLAASIVVADAALKAGETSLVTFTFSEAVQDFDNADLDLALANGTLSDVTVTGDPKVWTATFTPTADIVDTTNVISLNMTGVTDLAGNVGAGSSPSSNYTIDTKLPTATIAVAKTALAPGETSLVTITFSEAVTGFSNSDLNVPHGGLTAVSTSDNITWTATYTPNANVLDTANIISLTDGSVDDLAGNAGSTASSDNFAINTVAPTATIFVADQALKIGDTSLVTFTFTEAVSGFTNADLTIEGGTLSDVSTSDSITWTATFTPNASTPDLTNVITLNNAGVVGVTSGNAGIGESVSNNYAIDTVRPTATSIVFADAELKIGDTSLVTFTFSEAVTGFTNADLTIANGTLTAVSNPSLDGITWTATFTPTSAIWDTTNVITLDNTGVADVAGNAGSGTRDSNNYAIDTMRPTATIFVADNALSAGETSLVTFTFAEKVMGFTNADLTIANGTLSAVLDSGDGITWTANLTPDADVSDATNVITLANTGVADVAGNAGTGTTLSNNFAINTALPTATIVVADAALKVGDTSMVTITFSEAVTGFTNADLTVANGTLSMVTSSDGDITYTATFTPTNSLTDATNFITLDNTGVQSSVAGNTGAGTTDSNNYAIDTTRPTASIVVADSALGIGQTSLVTFTFSEAIKDFTNADLTVAGGTLSAVSSGDGGIVWTATFTPVTPGTGNVITLDMTGIADNADNAGTGTVDSNTYTVDLVRPTVTSIVVADPVLKAGETSLVTITFSEAVTGFDNTDISIPNGTLTAVSSSNGGTVWSATFRPTDNVSDTTNVISVNNTGFIDLAGNTGAATSNSDNFTINTVRPTVTSIVVADPDLKAGETSGVTITFSEAVTGFTLDDLRSENGELSDLDTADGVTWTAIFTPTDALEAADNIVELDKTGVTSIASGNAGVGEATSNTYDIDTARPTVSIVVADSDIGIGQTSLVTFTFSREVTGFTLADLTSENGELSDLDTDDGVTWTAIFTPDADINDAENIISLKDASVFDLATNANAGATDSNVYKLDAARPTATITLANTALVAGQSTGVTIKFSEAVTGFDNTDLTTIEGGLLSPVSSADGGVTWTATFTAGVTTDATNVISFNTAGVTDLAGNAGTGTTTSANYTISPYVPPVQPEPTTPTPTPGDDVITLPATGGTISAGEGADSVAGVAGDDIINGNVGDDSVSGGGGDDIVRGGQGADFVQGNTGDDLIFGDIGQDTVHGGQGTDFVQGNAGDDYVSGDLGNDTVLGGQGDDVVIGGAGDDIVSGDLGNDILTGGTGADLFNFSGGAGHDVVTDFSRAEGDHIRIAPSDAANFSALSSHITSQGADTLITLGAQTVVLVGVSAGSLTAADFVFA